MNKTIGNFDDTAEELISHFTVTFYLDNFNLKWGHCTITADFLAQYFAIFFPDSGDISSPLISKKEVHHYTSYLINELMENSVKFNDGGSVNVSMGLLPENKAPKEIGFTFENSCRTEGIEKFQELISEIANGDPEAMLLEKIEANALDNEGTGSGLGILTLMNDYGVRIGWKFRDGADKKLSLSTMARLDATKGE